MHALVQLQQQNCIFVALNPLVSPFGCLVVRDFDVCIEIAMTNEKHAKRAMHQSLLQLKRKSCPGCS